MKRIDIPVVFEGNSNSEHVLVRWNVFFRRGVQIGAWLFIGFFCLTFVAAFLFSENTLAAIFVLCSFTFAVLSILSQKLAEKGSEMIVRSGLVEFSVVHDLKVATSDERQVVSFPEMMTQGGERPEIRDVLLGQSQDFFVEYFSYTDSIQAGKDTLKRALFVHHIDMGYAMPEFFLYKSDLAEKETETGRMQYFFNFQITEGTTQIPFTVEGIGDFILLVEKQYEIEALQICTEPFVRVFAEQSVNCVLQGGDQDLYMYTYGLPEQNLLEGYQTLFSAHQIVVAQLSAMARGIGGSVEALRERTSVLPLSRSADTLTHAIVVPIDDTVPETVLWEGKCHRVSTVLGWIIAFFVIGAIVYGLTFILSFIAFLLGVFLFIIQVSSLFDFLASEYRVTNKRVVIRYGWKKKKVVTLSRSAIQDVQIRAALFLWLFDVASLRIVKKDSSTDGGVFNPKATLFYIKDYEQVKDIILLGSVEV